MTDLTRRDTLSLLAALSALGLAPAHAQTPEAAGMTLGTAVPFNPVMVQLAARDLAANPFQAPPMVPKGWQDLSFDQFRGIWFDTRHTLWRGTKGAAQVEFFPAGLYFTSPVRINAVERNTATPVKFELRVFDTTDQFPKLPEEGAGFAGFRLLGEVEAEGRFQEYTVFQGATYFRAIARGQNYGLSARGLALKTASPEGEEFPFFSEFWIEAAVQGAASVRVHALMDSPSVTGAYTFTIARGDPCMIEVEARLYPRIDLNEVGIAPGTSMFTFNQANRAAFDDFRDAVHDSDGLLMLTGASELIWRPLTNPKTLEISAFADTSPRGFGLMQRARQVGAFEDLVAHYENRPSLWVEPIGDWGQGDVVLVEIPTDTEVNDNIVAFWRPRQPLKTGAEHLLRYRLYWCDAAPVEGTVARVIDTRTGARIWEEGRIFALDFEPHPALGTDPEQIEALITTSAGEVTGWIVQTNAATGGMRLDFTVHAPGAATTELRAELHRNGVRVSEIWLNRWVAQ